MWRHKPRDQTHYQHRDYALAAERATVLCDLRQRSNKPRTVAPLLTAHSFQHPIDTVWTADCLLADAKNVREWQDHNLGTAIAVLVRHDRGASQCDKSTKRRYWQCEPWQWPCYAVRILNICLNCRCCWHLSSYLWECTQAALRIGTEIARSWVLFYLGYCALAEYSKIEVIVLFTFFGGNNFFDLTSDTLVTFLWNLNCNMKAVCCWLDTQHKAVLQKIQQQQPTVFGEGLFSENCRLLVLYDCAWYHT